MPVAIVTDSAAALPPELAAAHGIGIVPMWLTIDGRAVREGEIPRDELLSRTDVKTSGPAPGETEDAVANRLAAGGADSGVVLTITSTMSSTFVGSIDDARTAGGP